MRKSSTQRGYNYTWQKFRKVYLKENPLCAFCQQQNIVTPATVVDHIEPHRGDKKLFWNMDNLQPLCHSCHASTKQAIECGSKRPVIGLDGWSKDE